MDDKTNQVESHLFRIRLWVEDLGNGRSEWRGKVQHVLSGKEQYFRTWAELQRFMKSTLPGQEDELDEAF